MLDLLARIKVDREAREGGAPGEGIASAASGDRDAGGATPAEEEEEGKSNKAEAEDDARY